MTESAAICHYLVTKYGPTPLAVTPDEPDYADYLNFLTMAEATLTFPQTVYLRYTLLEPDERKLPQAAADYAQMVRLTLQGRRHHDGPRIRLRLPIHRRRHLARLQRQTRQRDRPGEAVPPRAQQYWEHLRQRPAVKRAEGKEGQGSALDPLGP